MRKYIIYAIIAAMSLLWIGCGQGGQAPVFELEEETSEAAPDWSEEDLRTLLDEVVKENLALLQINPVIEVTCDCTGQAQVQQIVQEALPVLQQAPEEEDKVNINTADLAALQTLNGIGESRAQAIISYRESAGAFQAIEDIKQVDGIGDGIFSKIKDAISVG